MTRLFFCRQDVAFGESDIIGSGLKGWRKQID
jgi:hypothetical protein